jgi:hypothetical protein
MGDLHVPVWFSIGAVLWAAIGHWKAADGWRHGWLVSATGHGSWLVFALLTKQWAILAGPVLYGGVAVRNWLVIKKREDGNE